MMVVGNLMVNKLFFANFAVTLNNVHMSLFKIEFSRWAFEKKKSKKLSINTKKFQSYIFKEILNI